jgi:hypothetical protein
VTIERCLSCNQQWLRYFFEQEALSKSGRWYRIPVSDAEAASVTETTALELMTRCSWHFYAMDGALWSISHGKLALFERGHEHSHGVEVQVAERRSRTLSSHERLGAF